MSWWRNKNYFNSLNAPFFKKNILFVFVSFLILWHAQLWGGGLLLMCGVN